MSISPKQSFAQTLKEQLDPNKEISSPMSLLTDMDYEEEIRLKKNALQQFWSTHNFPGQPEPILRSPKTRHYRATSKRRVSYKNRFYKLFLMDDDAVNSELLEAESHAVLYHFFQQELNRPANSVLSRQTQYVIIRGSYDAPSVILNVDEFNAPVIRRAKAIAEKLQHLPVNVFSVFLYLDPTHSQYYLESKRPTTSVSFKKLSGPDLLYCKVHNMVYSYSPLCFSQVNESIVPELLIQVSELLSPQSTHRLIDLYCGYGLFSHYLASHCAEVIGMEISSAAIQSAIVNKRYLNPDIPMRFIAKSIDRASLNKMLPPPDDAHELLLLDPPYQGTNAGVIETLTHRNAERILHIFCSMDALGRELGLYLKNGCQLKRAVAMDLFPGTANLEMLLLFTRS